MNAGIDIGSRTAKAIILEDNVIIGSALVDTGANPAISGSTAFNVALQNAGAAKESIHCIVATGYGRVSLDFAHRNMTELSCHAMGAHFLAPEVKTVIDIGGQDSKVIRVDDQGQLVDFMMNDKCAAGTGRFLEVAARALEMDLDALSLAGMDAPAPCAISSMCAVFAESEIISLLASGEDKENIAAGLNQAFARRLANMAKRVGVAEPVAFVGGVAKNMGLARAISELLGVELVGIDMDPQLVGALGAAVIAGNGG